MSKTKSIILTILLIISILYGIFFTIATVAIWESYFELSDEHDTLSENYSEVVESYKELHGKYSEVIEDDLSIPVVIQGIAKSIGENAVVTKFDERVIHIIVSYSTDIKDKVEESYHFITSALRTSGYESCVISVVDENGKCVYGWTVFDTGDYNPFVSD